MLKKLLVLAIISYIVFFSWFCFWKYSNFGYNVMDVAIYNQVFYNSAHGHLFQFTLHPQSYLGDHLELFILALLPIYYFFQSPLTLLFLQTIFLAACAWPLYLIAKKIINEKLAFLLGLTWLFNPFVQNTNLFEFHLLPFALFFIFWAFYFYLGKKFWPFMLFLLISLLVREDVTLITGMFGILALIEKRPWKWVIYPIIISGVWFFAALKIIGHFAPVGVYKFLYYYSWLGETPLEIAKNFFFKPLLVIGHLATWQNLFFLLGIFLPFGYLSVFQPKYLLLSLPILLQMLLAGGNNTAIVLDVHYVALFLPALFIALIFEIKKITERDKLNKIEAFLRREKLAFYLLLAITSLYTCLSLGPILGLWQKNFKKEELDNKKLFLKEIKSSDSLATTFEYLTNLSNRPNLYSLHYAYIGKQQFSQLDYALPKSTDKILADTSDLITYQIYFPNIKIWDGYSDSGDNRLRDFLKTNNFQVAMARDTLVLWEKNVKNPFILYEINPATEKIKNSTAINMGNKINFLGQENNLNQNQLSLSLYFQALEKISENYNLRLVISDFTNTEIYEKLYPLAYGLYPTTDWQIGEIIKINYSIILPADLGLQNKKIILELVEQKGFLTLNKIRQAIPYITKEKILGKFLLAL